MKDIFLNTSKGNNLTDVQYTNRRLILSLIQKYKSISRTQLAEMSGLKPATITIIVNDFLSKNLIFNNGYIDGNRGRKMAGISLIKDKFCTINVRLTSSYCAIGLFDIDSEAITIEKKYFLTFEDSAYTLDFIKERILHFITLTKELHILGISVGIQGNALFVRDNIFYFCDAKKKAKELIAFFNSFCSLPVYVDYSVNFMNYWFSTFSRHDLSNKTALVISFSTSIDYSLIRNNHFFDISFPALKHLPGIYIKSRNGSLALAEDLLSINYYKKRIPELLEDFPDSILNTVKDFQIRDIIDAFSKDDTLANYFYSEIAEYVTQFLIIMANLFTPDCIIIGDEIPNNLKFFNYIQSYLSRYDDNHVFNYISLQYMDTERATKNDPVLRGGNSIIVNNELAKLSLNNN